VNEIDCVFPFHIAELSLRDNAHGRNIVTVGKSRTSALHLNETAVLAEKKRLVVAAILRRWRIPAFFARIIVGLLWRSTSTAVVLRVLRSAESATLYGRQLDRCMVRSLS